MTYNRKTLIVDAISADVIITIASVKAFLRVDGTDDDDMIQSFLDAAIESAERFTRRAIREQTLSFTMDGFPYGDDDRMARLGPGVFQVPLSYLTGASASFDLPYPPVASVTSIKVYDDANVEATVNPAWYRLTNDRVSLNDSYSWPTGLRATEAVKVTYEAGYGAAVPASIVLAIKQHVSAMYDCRSGCDIPAASKNLLSSYVIMDQLAW